MLRGKTLSRLWNYPIKPETLLIRLNLDSNLIKYAVNLVAMPYKQFGGKHDIRQRLAM